MSFLYILLLQGFVFADCTMGKDDPPLRIGCTDKCGKTYLASLNEAAELAGYKIEISTMTSENDLDNLDAVLSPGGHDIHPQYFNKNLSDAEKEKIMDLHNRKGNNGKVKPEHGERDKLEYAIMKKYVTHDAYKDTPLLGVCYGMQMMAAVKDIPLYVDIPEQLGISSRRKIYDYINVQGDSVLKPLTGNEILGYKNHHQAVDMSYFKKNSGKHSTVKITATSHDGKIPEVMEWTDRPALGIQYHAERSNAYSMKTARAEQSDRHGPYLWLLKKACTKRNKKTVQEEASSVEILK